MPEPQPSADSDVRLLWRVARNGWRYKWLIAGFVTVTAMTGGLWAFLFKALGPFITVLGQPAGEATARAASDLNWLGLTMLALAPIAAATAYLSWFLGQLVANRAMRDLRDRVLRHLVSLEIAWHQDLTRGDLLARLTTDLGSVLKVQQYLYGKLLQRPLQTVGILLGLFWNDWQVAAAVTLALIPVGFALAPVVRRTRRRSKEARAKLVENLGVLEQITAGIRVIKAMGSDTREGERYAAHNQRLFQATMRVARARAASDAITYGAIFLIGAGAMSGGGWLWAHGHLALERLILGLGALGFLITGLRETVRAWGDLQELLPSAERVFAVLDRAPAIIDAPQAVELPVPRTAIILDQVRFRYQSDAAEVLRGIDLEIPIGRTTALVGTSGGGKSTILDLLARFHDPTGGRITIDGIDLRTVALASWSRHLGIVLQENFLFDDTVYANIAYGRPGASITEVEAAAKKAHVHDDILRLEGGQGYATPVGDRGCRLSGGQRQRVAIARAFLRDAPILLLDEPTSALDAESEEHVQVALRDLIQGRTVVLVAHRLATVRHADRIHVLAGKDDARRGTVLESGTHDELVARGGRYAELVQRQSLD